MPSASTVRRSRPVSCAAVKAAASGRPGMPRCWRLATSEPWGSRTRKKVSADSGVRSSGSLPGFGRISPNVGAGVGTGVGAGVAVGSGDGTVVAVGLALPSPLSPPSPPSPGSLRSLGSASAVGGAEVGDGVTTGFGGSGTRVGRTASAAASRLRSTPSSSARVAIEAVTTPNATVSAAISTSVTVARPNPVRRTSRSTRSTAEPRGRVIGHPANSRRPAPCAASGFARGSPACVSGSGRRGRPRSSRHRGRRPTPHPGSGAATRPGSGCG